MEQSLLDCTLVPLGLVMMISYHLWLLFQIVSHPYHTIIGVNAVNRDFWVRAMMEDTSKNGVLAVQTLRNNIMASTLLASTAIMLSSLIAMLMVGNKSGNARLVLVLMGDTSDKILSLKFFSILLCFLLAFLFTVQSIRYYSHASFLINVPSTSRCLCLCGYSDRFQCSCAALCWFPRSTSSTLRSRIMSLVLLLMMMVLLGRVRTEVVFL